MPDLLTASSGPGATLSPAQQKFNKLLVEIDKEKQRLIAWREVHRQYRERFAAELDPLACQIDERKVEIVLLLDKVHFDQRLGKRQRARLEDVVRALTYDLLRVMENDELKRIESEYSLRSPEPDDFDDPAFDDPFAGPDNGMSSPAEPGTGGHGPAHMDHADEPPLFRKQTAAQQAREQAEAQRDKEAQHAVRDVYRTLASALHPDREPDSAERARKTALMQRVNVAYAAKNLLALLELQLEIEQIDQAAINSISTARLAHFNRVLAVQFKELKTELFLSKQSLYMDYGVPDELTRLPVRALRWLDRSAQMLREDLACAERDVEMLQDIKGIRAWLNGVLLAPAMDDGFGDIEEFMAFAAMLDKR